MNHSEASTLRPSELDVLVQIIRELLVLRALLVVPEIGVLPDVLALLVKKPSRVQGPRQQAEHHIDSHAIAKAVPNLLQCHAGSIEHPLDALGGPTLKSAELLDGRHPPPIGDVEASLTAARGRDARTCSNFGLGEPRRGEHINDTCGAVNVDLRRLLPELLTTARLRDT